MSEIKRWSRRRCRRCGEFSERADFYHVRTLGVACERCVLAATGYATIEEYQRASFGRGASPRGA